MIMHVFYQVIYYYKLFSFHEISEIFIWKTKMIEVSVFLPHSIHTQCKVCLPQKNEIQF